MDDDSIWRCIASTVQPSVASTGISAGSIVIYAILFALLIAGGAYFAGAEISLASVNRIHMRSCAEDGNKKAQYVMYILNNFEKALTTILIGNNIMHIACASIATLFTRQFFKGTAYLDTALVISTIIITIIVFLISEMLPKSYAKTYSERFALRIGKSLYVLMKILTPLAAVFTWIGSGLGRLLAGKRADEPSVTEDDLKDMIESFKDEREEDEETEDSTAELMVSALEFGTTTAKEALTPWSKVETLDSSMEISEIYARVKASSHSRLPMLNAKGRIVGVLNIRAFLKAYMRDGDETELIDLIDTPLFVRPDVPVDELLSEMSRSKVHLAFVSVQGDVQGIITIEDILEELVGEIFDEYDTPEATDDASLSEVLA